MFWICVLHIDWKRALVLFSPMIRKMAIMAFLFVCTFAHIYVYFFLFGVLIFFQENWKSLGRTIAITFQQLACYQQ
jgi:hypothetical protein